MNAVSFGDAVKQIRLRLRENLPYPYFVIADGAEEYIGLKKEFGALEQIHVSDFCNGDTPLDVDLFIEKLKSLDRDAVCFGLGEYVRFTGQDILRKLQDRSFDRNIIIVCRGATNEIERIADDDRKFRANRLCKIAGKWKLKVVKYKRNVSVPTDADNFAEFMKLAAGCDRDFLTVKTDFPLVNVTEANDFDVKIPVAFKSNAAAINDYLTNYDFGDAAITNYFRRYKQIKLFNVDDEDFKALVRDWALKRPFNQFETRRAVLDRADKSAKLYWLDALGVEFLGYIQLQTERRGLVTKIEIVRADLPTLTSQNRYFYDEWAGGKFDKNQRLDDLKHSDEKFDAAGKCSPPLYINDELRLIDGALDEIAAWLNDNAGRKVILTSDHGASRLAVMYGRENKHRLSSAGRHGGRCCLANEVDARPSCATMENGWWVLANYDRFAGGRLASVEVHGGATLEEVLVPVIEISFPNAVEQPPPKAQHSKAARAVHEGFDFFD